MWHTPAYVLLAVSAFWIASELVILRLKWASKAESTSHDRGSIVLIWILFGCGPFLASVVSHGKATRMPLPMRPYAFWSGVALIAIGIVIRWIAIRTLARYFTVNVAIAKDHQVIDRGLYAIVRHPSYAGTLLSMTGLGLAFTNWLSLVICIVIAVAALSYRIVVEERALIAALGDDYRAYAARTKRLIPGVF